MRQQTRRQQDTKDFLSPSSTVLNDPSKPTSIMAPNNIVSNNQVTLSTENNRISNAINRLKGMAEPAKTVWNGLGGLQRLISGVAMAFVLVLPVIWLVLVSPFLFIAIAILYSLFFGFGTFVNHLESALKEHFNVSDKSIEKVHENATFLKKKAETAKAKFGSRILDTIYLVFYTITIYSLKSIEFIIKKLQCLSGLLKSSETKARQNLKQQQKRPFKKLGDSLIS